MTGARGADKFRGIAVASVLAAACAALAACSFFASAWVDELDGERAALERESRVMTDGIARLINQKRDLNAAVEELNVYCGAMLDRLGLYSDLRQIATANSVDIISTRWEDAPPGRGGANSLAMVLRGDYHDIMTFIASCRALQGPVRAVELALHPLSDGDVEAGITMEAILASQ